jgi:hypothetical protein
MKMTLILLSLLPLTAWAVQKNYEVRHRTKAVAEKYTESVIENRPPKGEETITHDVRTSKDRSRQLESKESRQFQEEKLKARE